LLGEIEMKGDRAHNPVISAILDGIAAVAFVAGGIMLLAAIVKEYWVCAIGASAIVTGLLFVARSGNRSLARAREQSARALIESASAERERAPVDRR
jgi:TM2 domain-containing membrane protein YozV